MMSKVNTELQTALINIIGHQAEETVSISLIRSLAGAAWDEFDAAMIALHAAGIVTMHEVPDTASYLVYSAVQTDGHEFVTVTLN